MVQRGQRASAWEDVEGGKQTSKDAGRSRKWLGWVLRTTLLWQFSVDLHSRSEETHGAAISYAAHAHNTFLAFPTRHTGISASVVTSPCGTPQTWLCTSISEYVCLTRALKHMLMFSVLRFVLCLCKLCRINPTPTPTGGFSLLASP